MFPAKNIDYRAFSQLNDLCFPHEPVSEYQYQAYLSVEFWSLNYQDRFIGFSVLTIGENNAHINRIGIHPDYRSLGLGTRLMEAMIEKAKASEQSKLSLSVQQDNLSAIRFYEKLGFTVAGESVQFSVNILPAVVDDYSIVPITERINWDGTKFPHQTMAYLKARHDPPHTYGLVFTRKQNPICCTCFSPDFPGCSPFVLMDEVDDIMVLVSFLKAYVLKDKQTIKITTGNQLAISKFESTGTKENYRLFDMTKQIG